MEWTWLILFVLFLIIEGLTFNFFTIWFALGALGAFITAYITTNVTIQLVVFLASAILLLIFTRPIVKKRLKMDPIKTNLDAVVGKIGIVTKKIGKHEYGLVKVAGKEWTATSSNPIKEGAEVEILRIDGVKLVVEKKEEK